MPLLTGSRAADGRMCTGPPLVRCVEGRSPCTAPGSAARSDSAKRQPRASPRPRRKAKARRSEHFATRSAVRSPYSAFDRQRVLCHPRPIMPAPIDPALREAVKAHAIQHGIRPACEHFNLPVSTVGSWSERDPNGPWCPKNPPAIARPATLTRANTANSPSQAALNANAKRDARIHRNGVGYADHTLRFAHKAARKEPGRALAMAADVKAVVQIAQAANVAGFERQQDTGSRTAINILVGEAPVSVSASIENG